MQTCYAYNSGSIMVRAGVIADRCTDLVVIPGILNGQRYIDEVFHPYVLLFLQPMDMNNMTFQDNNARLNRACISSTDAVKTEPTV